MVIQGVTYLSDFEAKKAIIAAAARLEARGCMPAGDGSISVRVGPNAVWTTLAGSNKGALTQDMMIRVDLNGKTMGSAHPKPLPEDLPIHLKIYQEHKDVQCVIHSYPVCAAILGMKGKNLEPGTATPAVRRLGRVQCLPVKTALEQAAAVSLLCATDHAAVIREDGCLTWGRTLTDAMGYIEALDYYCQVLEKTSQGQQGGCGQNCVRSDCGCQNQNCDDPAAAGQNPERTHILSGVTGLIRPGGTIPPLPEPETEQNMSEPTVAVQSAKPMLAIDAPKEEVMAEVIRKTLAMLG